MNSYNHDKCRTATIGHGDHGFSQWKTRPGRASYRAKPLPETASPIVMKAVRALPSRILQLINGGAAADLVFVEDFDTYIPPLPPHRRRTMKARQAKLPDFEWDD